MNTFYILCFVLGLVLSLLAVFAGAGHLHVGHGHWHFHTHGKSSGQFSAFNGFTLPAFLCWFGGAGYLLHQHSRLIGAMVLLMAVLSGLAGAAIIYTVLFKFLIPRERILLPEDTRMEGVIARVSNEIRADGIGEILFSQTGARRSAAARSQSGAPIARGTEVVVLHYERGIAYVSSLSELNS